MEDLQNITNLDAEIRDILGIELWTTMKHSTKPEQVTILVNFLIDTYGFLFEKEDLVDDLTTELDILTDISDDEYELSDDIMNAIIGISTLIDGEDMIEEIKLNIKSILVYIVEVLQS